MAKALNENIDPNALQANIRADFFDIRGVSFFPFTDHVEKTCGLFSVRAPRRGAPVPSFQFLTRLVARVT
jgi:hypothetical protein